MDYPILQLDFFGGGFWIATVAVVHVFIAHFAVGGGLFLVLTEHLARRKDSPAILAYTEIHAKFFLVLTLSAGAVTGAAIWFIISVLSPKATSHLIHLFVFAWSAEWACFLAEIIAIIVYAYTFHRMRKGTHLAVGWLYFLFAWLSLVIITGIINYMLTPGDYPQTGRFLDAFLNPSFASGMVFRTFTAMSLAGLFGYLTATRIKDDEARAMVSRYCGLWTAAPVILTGLSGWWYLETIPAQAAADVLAPAFYLRPYYPGFLWLAGLLIAGGLIMGLRLPRGGRTALAAVLLVLGLAWIGSFEFLREGARRPWLVRERLYSNHMTPAEVTASRDKGLAAMSPWLGNATGQGPATGKSLFHLQCGGCHSVGGPLNDIIPLTAHIPPQGMEAFLTGISKACPYMPPVGGTDVEKTRLAGYISKTVNNKTETGIRQYDPPQTKTEIPSPAFGPGKEEYVLLAQSSLGMHAVTDSGAWWAILPPGSDFSATLVKRGAFPELVTDARIVYELEPGFQEPALKTDFWSRPETYFGKKVEPGQGPDGLGPTGDFSAVEETRNYKAEGVPVVPYPEGNDGFMPYPMMDIRAVDAEGATLVETKAVAPASTEMGCRNCHGGPWKVDGLAGISAPTARDVLRVHDLRRGTDLLQRAEADDPRLCQDCHADPLLDREGDPDLLNLSAAIHGFHALFLSGRGADACAMCHPSREDGPTRSYRGRHAAMGLDCTLCHGTMEDHSLSLLKAQKDKAGARRLMDLIEPVMAASVDEIEPRKPWVNEPDCLTCHKDFQAPTEYQAFNTWTKDEKGLFRNRMDQMYALKCTACHNAPHAVYPANNPYGQDRDNVQPIQYMGRAGTIGGADQKGGQGCPVCHTEDKEFSGHHPGQLQGTPQASRGQG